MIRLNKDELVVFMGSMNSMPMMYALELKNRGYKVLYFVDAKKSNTLCRPEHHFPNISYPYPSWIVELTLPSQILLPIFPWVFSLLYQWRIRQVTKVAVGVFFLNGFFASLAPHLSSRAYKIGLSHGSDLDVWANLENTDALAVSFGKRSIFKFIPTWLSKKLIMHIISKQYNGYVSSNTVCYFPCGFNEAGDNVIKSLINSGVKYVPRYDISFELLRGQPRYYKSTENVLRIFSIVRFLFKTFPDSNKGYSKGNDIIIEGIAKYYKLNKNVRIDFVEKGEDVEYAKQLCEKNGLKDVVVWHKEMSFKTMLSLLVQSDVCFDQVGEHWIGAGVYAMWLGKPLIANPEAAILAGVWPDKNPVCSARTPEEVCECLVRLRNVEYRREVSNGSKRFIEAQMGPQKALSKLFEF